MTPHSIRQYYNRLLFSIGIRNEPKRRHEFSVNGFRKYFKTMAEQAGMAPINVEILMGHSVGISDSYYRPTEQSLREDYLKAVDKLMVLTPPPSPAQQQEIVMLSERHQALTLQMESKEAEIHTLKERMDKMGEIMMDLESGLRYFRYEFEHQRGGPKLNITDEKRKKLDSGMQLYRKELMSYIRRFHPTPIEHRLSEKQRKGLEEFGEKLRALPPASDSP